MYQLQGHGLIARLETHYLGWLRDTSCGGEITGESRTLTFSDIWASLLVLPAGLGLAFFILLWERTGIYGKKMSSENENQRNASDVSVSEPLARRWDGISCIKNIIATSVTINLLQINLPEVGQTFELAGHSDPNVNSMPDNIAIQQHQAILEVNVAGANGIVNSNKVCCNGNCSNI